MKGALAALLVLVALSASVPACAPIFVGGPPPAAARADHGAVAAAPARPGAAPAARPPSRAARIAHGVGTSLALVLLAVLTLVFV